MSPIMDFSKETSNNPIYPNGTYKVKLTKWERCKASNGTPQIRWYCAILEPIEHQGRTIVDHTAMLPQTLWKSANMIAAFGVNTSKMPAMDTDGEAFSLICNSCVGRTAYWRNEQTPGKDKYGAETGRMKNNIAEYANDPDQPVIDYSAGPEVEVPDFLKN